MILLEAGFCGCGTASRNAGQLTGAPAGEPQLLSAMHPRRFPALVRFAEQAAHFTEGLTGRLGTDRADEPTGNVGAAASEGQLRKARRCTRILQRAGTDVQFGDGRDPGLPEGFVSGFLERVGRLLNPGELALAPRRLATPIRVNMAETQPIAPERLAATGWTSRSGIAAQHRLMQSFRPTPHGTVTVVFGVRRLQTARGTPGAREPAPAAVADRPRLPRPLPVAPRCDAATGVGRVGRDDTLAATGCRRGDEERLPHRRLNRHGLGQAPYLGTLPADRPAGYAPHDDLDTVWRPRPRFAPAPLLNAPTLPAAWALDRLPDRFGAQGPGPCPPLIRRTGPSDHRHPGRKAATIGASTAPLTATAHPTPPVGPAPTPARPAGPRETPRPESSDRGAEPQVMGLVLRWIRWAIRGSNPEPMD